MQQTILLVVYISLLRFESFVRKILKSVSLYVAGLLVTLPIFFPAPLCNVVPQPVRKTCLHPAIPETSENPFVQYVVNHVLRALVSSRGVSVSLSTVQGLTVLPSAVVRSGEANR